MSDKDKMLLWRACEDMLSQLDDIDAIVDDIRMRLKAVRSLLRVSKP